MMSRLRLCLAAVILWLATLVLASNAYAQSSSPYGVYVEDGAGLLQPQTAQLLYRNAIWIHKQTGTAQVGVVTVPTIGNTSLEEFAVAKFRELGLGSKERNDGVMLLYTAKENHVRIEVGYGLEGRIPDGLAGAILDQYFVPNLRAGDIDRAFVQTQGALIQQVAAEYGVDTSEKTGNGELPLPPDTRTGQEPTNFLAHVPGFAKILIVIGIILLIFLDFKFTGGALTYALLSMVRRGGSSGGGGFGGGRGGGGSSGGGGASR
ncbi:TPM domain-containing protein [Brevibacillus fluminis]|uniref:TPM domain-containing protein n=1 Tax=Brevibacillus fluminis TaxID=511487 RepID=UPI003F88E2B4